jgi:hypothetical protein
VKELYTFVCPFESRETYLDWRANWKQKQVERETARKPVRWDAKQKTYVKPEYTPDELQRIRQNSANFTKYRDDIYRAEKWLRAIKAIPYNTFIKFSSVARLLLAELEAAKLVAGKQRQQRIKDELRMAKPKGGGMKQTGLERFVRSVNLASGIMMACRAANANSTIECLLALLIAFINLSYWEGARRR